MVEKEQNDVGGVGVGGRWSVFRMRVRKEDDV